MPPATIASRPEKLIAQDQRLRSLPEHESAVLYQDEATVVI